MYVMLPHFFKKGKVVHVTLMGVNDDEVGMVKFANFGKVLHKMNTILMKLVFCNISL